VTKAEAVTAERSKTTSLVISVRVLYGDGEVAYITVTGTAIAQEAQIIAWQQAELERPDQRIISADLASITENDPTAPPEAQA
jgi:hypothetical protein